MSFLKRKSTIAVAVLLLAILIGSYGYMVYQQQQMNQQQQQTLEAKQKDFQKTITYVQHQVPRIVGYPLTYPSYNEIIVKETYETLARYEGSSLDFKPSLAEKWEVSPDGKVYTFYLRKNVNFYPSGDPFNAQAVKFTFDTAFRRNPETTAPISLFGGLDWVMYDHTEIVNDYTVKIYINRPLAWFMRIVAFVQTGGIMNQKFINAHGGPPNSIDTIDPYLIWHQDVTGPYIVDEFALNDHVTLKRNPTWWGWNSTNANRPERVVVRVVPETATRMMLIGRGDADIAYVDLQYLPELKRRIASENLPLAMDESPSPAEQHIVLDNLHPPTNDVHIRRMLAWSFNYDEYIKTIMSGFGNRLITFVPKGMWGYQPDVPYYTFNLDKAKQELDLATPGNRSMVQQGIKVQYTPGYALGKEGYLMWKSDLAKIGVNLILDELAYSTYRDVMHAGNVPILDRAWSPDFPDPATFYQFLYSTYYVAKAFGTTPSRISELLDKAAFETSQDTRLGLYRQVEEWAYDSAAYIKVASKAGGGIYNVRGTWVKGYQTFPLYDAKPLFYELWKELPTTISKLPSTILPTLNIQTNIMTAYVKALKSFVAAVNNAFMTIATGPS